MQASGLTGFIPSIWSSAIWGQPCFLVHLKEQQMAASCFPPAPQQSPWGVGASPGSVLGTLIHVWRPEITDGCCISCLFIWQEIFSFHKIMVKTQSWTFLYVLPWDVTSPVFNLFLVTRLLCGFQSGNLLVGENGYSFPYSAQVFMGQLKL